MILDGERRGADPRQDPPRRHVGQHRDRLRHDRRRAGLPGRAVPARNATPERKRILTAYGAELVLTDPMEGSDGAILEGEAPRAEDPDLYFYPDQYNNPANWRAHYDTTGPEIIEQTGGPADALRRRPRHQRHLHRARPALARVQPGDQLHLGPARLAAPRPRRAEAHGHGDRPRHLRPVAGRRDIGRGAPKRRTTDAALAREEGLVGVSRAARRLAGALRVAAAGTGVRSSSRCADGGEKYLSERFWDETRGRLRSATRSIGRGGADPAPWRGNVSPTNAAAR